MNEKTANCYNCNVPISLTAEDSLYHWCFLVEDPKAKHGFSEIRLGSTISDIDAMLSQFEKEMPNLEVIGYTSIPKKYLQDERQIFVIIEGQLQLNPQMLPLY